MKYLRNLLTAYQQLAVTSVIASVVLLGAAAPAYAGTGAVTCAGGPSFGTTSTAVHNGKGEDCFVTLYINPIVKILGALVGVFVVLSIIIAGIQYSAAADDSSKVAAAKGRIQKALIALLVYALLFAFINYVVPGGV